VLAEFGRVPRVGEAIDLEGYRLVVENVIRRRVKRIAIHRQRIEASVAPSEKAGR
jgi:CBS domain containing-hemolysin-like protein